MITSSSTIWNTSLQAQQKRPLYALYLPALAKYLTSFTAASAPGVTVDLSPPQIIQSAHATTIGTSIYTTVSLGSLPTPGNTLLLIISGGKLYGAASVGPPGFTPVTYFEATIPDDSLGVMKRIVQPGDGTDYTFELWSILVGPLYLGPVNMSIYEIVNANFAGISGSSGVAAAPGDTNLSTNVVSSATPAIVLGTFQWQDTATFSGLAPSSYQDSHDFIRTDERCAIVFGQQSMTIPTSAITGVVSDAPTQPLYATVVIPPNTPTALPFMFIPEGQGQSVDELSATSSISEHTIQFIDPNGYLKGAMAATTPALLGTFAFLQLGFDGMNMSDFVNLAATQVMRAGWTPDGRVEWNHADKQRATKEYIWVNGGPSAWQPGDATPTQPSGTATADNGQPISDKNPRYLQGNPVDLLLYAYQNELGLNMEAVVPYRDVDVDALDRLKYTILSGDWVEFTLKNQETAKNWIEDQVLKPLGLYTVVTSNGTLTFKPMKSPPPSALVDVPTWNDSSIIGIPSVDRWDIVNALDMRFDTEDSEKDTSSRMYNDTVTFEDDASVAQFRQQLIQQVELTGLRTRRGAWARALILSNRIFRRHAYGTPIYGVDVQLRNLQPELADYVYLTHRLVPDVISGTIGIQNVLCEVIERQPNYADGTLSYKLIDMRFCQQTSPHMVAPNATPAWTSASDEQKAFLMFISGDSGTMSDGSPAPTTF
jgi:hypothetical protein